MCSLVFLQNSKIAQIRLKRFNPFNRFYQISDGPGPFCWHGSDLQKAFDTVDHGILLMKLKALGLSPDVSRWFQSYLSDRQQLVDVSGTLSSHANISCGVPQ